MSESTAAPETLTTRALIGALSAIVVVAVALVIDGGPGPSTAALTPTPLARVNVGLNASAGLCLIAGFICVRLRRLAAHKVCMLGAFGLSSTFLVTYLLHHAQVGSVPFRGQGLLRTVYFAILVPHIILAAAIVPLALLTVFRGWTARLAAHRHIARWTLPLWLYVSTSGVVVYMLLYHVG